MKSFDLIVLGGGSGGLATAQRAVEYGARVVLFEPARLGGTCVNVGCVPKKVMWNAAELSSGCRLARDYGFDVDVRGHDFGRLKAARDAYIERLNGIYERNLDRKGIEVVRRRGRFAGPHEVIDDAGERYTAPHIVIATGGYPLVPGIPGASYGLTSDGFFELETAPARVAIYGSGYISVELAGVLNALGSRVTVMARYDRVLRSFDTLISDHLMQQMTDSGIEILLHTHVAAARLDRGQLLLDTTDGRQLGEFDAVIWAIGRTPNTAQLGLENAGITRTGEGHVPVDEFQNTVADGVYAVGDITGQPELTPVAIAAGRRLADRVFGGHAGRRLHTDIVPTVVFSHPPIGTIGLSEAEAHSHYPDERVKTYVSEFVPMLYALSETKPKTAMKLVTVGDDERAVGCHVIGPGADEMTQGFGVAMSMGARKRDFDDTIAIHPTSAEELVTMR